MKFKKFMAQICTFAFMFSNLISVHAVDVNVVVLGGPRAGKTSMIDRMLRNTFRDNYCHTKMPESYPLQIGDNNVYVWDIPDEEQRVAQVYVARSVAIAVIAVDVTNPKSIGDIGKYAELLKNAYKYTQIILAANKIDLGCSDRYGAELWNEVKKYNIDYAFFTSAKTGEGMEECQKGLLNSVNERVKAEAAQAEVYAELLEANDAFDEAVTNAALIEAYDALYKADNAAKAAPDEAEANAALAEARANVALAEAKVKAERDVVKAKSQQYLELGGRQCTIERKRGVKRF
ncbi:MAG: 50S ribosome-binding GTPase [Oscillospiraceae bacterium]|jgi:small GTP-binding protein|nr:50S ribosome-binding GTPase [Oscillospiraceae bacterium]